MGSNINTMSCFITLYLCLVLASTKALPTTSCPGTQPVVCGPEMIPCPGPFDYNGCMGPETCVSLNDTCPIICPHNPPVECGPDMMPCPGEFDYNGCMGPETCVSLNDTCPIICPYNPPLECGSDMMSCPGEFDYNGCM